MPQIYIFIFLLNSAFILLNIGLVLVECKGFLDGVGFFYTAFLWVKLALPCYLQGVAWKGFVFKGEDDPYSALTLSESEHKPKAIKE